MRKFALLLAVLLTASLSTSADAAKKRKAAKPDPVVASHQATAAFLPMLGIRWGSSRRLQRSGNPATGMKRGPCLALVLF